MERELSIVHEIIAVRPAGGEVMHPVYIIHQLSAKVSTPDYLMGKGAFDLSLMFHLLSADVIELCISGYAG